MEHKEASYLNSVYHSQNLLLQHYVTMLRDSRCSIGQFRYLMKQISVFLTYELFGVLRLPYRIVEAKTDQGDNYQGKYIDSPNICLIAAMRSGMVMASAAHEALQNSMIGHIGFIDAAREDIDPYYEQLPSDLSQRHCIIFDPAIATGKTTNRILNTITNINSYGAKPQNTSVVAINAIVPAVEFIKHNFPETTFMIGALDEKLNNRGWITPGLGDFQKRLYGVSSKEKGRMT